MFGGAVVVEAIFNWPGLSSMLLLATSRRDYPVVQAVILLIALVYVLINLTVDLAYSAVDPRVRYS
jgi:peptide/nickel transport system permease protein